MITMAIKCPECFGVGLYMVAANAIKQGGIGLKTKCIKCYGNGWLPE
jgi:hypothetical protein